MKKFALLVLTALLFAGCNNMLTNPDAFSVEEASVSMDISQLKARVATDGAVITSTLDFVGDEPKHSPFEKTQTINGSTINYTIKGLPVGSSVQFKLSVMKNGIVIFEGTSDKTTVKSKTDLKISLDKQSNWVVYYNGTCYGFDANFTPITQDNISGSSNYSIDIIYDGADDQEHIADIVAYCTDDKDNAYLISSEADDVKNLYRYNLPTKKLSLIAYDVSGDSPALAYDTVTDNLYILRESNGYHIIPNASTTNIVENAFMGEPNPYPEEFNYAYKFSIYDGVFYWIDSSFNYGVCKNSLSNEIELIKESSGEYSGVLYEEIITSTEGSSVPELTDIAVTKEGVFALLKNQVRINFGGTNSASRGGVIKMNHNLTTAKLYGWTESVHVITAKAQNGLEIPSRQYVPQSINDGFYGPTQILAIKPKKLIFTDIGGWAYHENGALQTQLKTSKNVIIFDLESCTYNSIPADLPTSGDSFFFPDISNYAGYTCSDDWED